ncbi:MAG: hypothetical protein JWP57_4016, partial [Spirosoma sp.]|nr:hypothetical protein [Spirosoma sp.]
RQRRRLLTEQIIAAGFGHNADAARVRIGHLEGFHRANVFPVIYPEHAADILWTLDFDGIRANATAMPKKRGRLRWLLAHHGYLPDAFLAELAGYSSRSVERARTEGTDKMSGVSYKGSPVGSTGVGSTGRDALANTAHEGTVARHV